MSVVTGAERLLANGDLQNILKGNVGLLCHSASITRDFELIVSPLKKILGERLKALFGPQHGFVTDVQDNMIETADYLHPWFKIPVYSLYGETRVPSDSMLQGIDTFVVDLQDVGTRVYTYIQTLYHVMSVCSQKGIRVVVLDRPNPVGCEIIEGNVLEPRWKSFVGLTPMPMRHAMTMGEVGRFYLELEKWELDYHVISMKNYDRKMMFNETTLPWVNPSPNLPTWEGALVFPGSVLYEGTRISEGRGTTRSLEIIGHPAIEPFSFADKLEKVFAAEKLAGFVARPLVFVPTFQKHGGKTCGGVQIHPTNPHTFRPWRVGQVLMREMFSELGKDFEWNDNPYEYQFEGLSIDYINGSEAPRKWVESNGSIAELEEFEKKDLDDFLQMRKASLIY